MNKVKHKRRHYQKFVVVNGWLHRLDHSRTIVRPVHLKGRSYMREMLDRLTAGAK